jgi:MYXO-CTERM domain-containing protein
VGTGAVNLSGQSVWLDTGLPGTTLNSSSLTVECWINTNGSSQEGNVLFSICTNSALDLSLYIAGPSNHIAIQTSAGIAASGTTTINDGNWHHVALVYDRTGMTLTGYVDGVQDCQATGQNLTFTAGSNVVFFNGRTTTSFGNWGARADEVRMHSSVVAPADFADTLSPVNPSGGGGDDGGDDEGCSTGGGSSPLFALLPAIAVGAALLRRRREPA